MRESNERALDLEHAFTQYEDGVTVKLRDKQRVRTLLKMKGAQHKRLHSIGNATQREQTTCPLLSDCTNPIRRWRQAEIGKHVRRTKVLRLDC